MPENEMFCLIRKLKQNLHDNNSIHNIETIDAHSFKAASYIYIFSDKLFQKKHFKILFTFLIDYFTLAKFNSLMHFTRGGESDPVLDAVKKKT